jgi:hypothetical protein
MLAVVTGDTVGVRGDRTVRGVSAGPLPEARVSLPTSAITRCPRDGFRRYQIPGETIDVRGQGCWIAAEERVVYDLFSARYKVSSLRLSSRCIYQSDLASPRFGRARERVP